MKKEKKQSLITIALLSALFGLMAGVVGDLLARVYVLDNIYNLPFFGEINFSNGGYRGSDIIIRDPRKVIVEQNDKVMEISGAVKSSLVGIYPKLKIGTKKEGINISDYYRTGQEVGQGLIITSDGWIITAFKPENLNYVAITGNKEIYQIDKIEKDTLTSLYFLHVAAKDLPVRKLVEKEGIKNGQLALAVSWAGDVDINTVIDANETGDKNTFSSDLYPNEVVLSNPARDEFKNSFLFNLSGDAIGLIGGTGEAEPMYHFSSAINTLLKNKAVKRPSLGVRYVDLSKMIYSLPAGEAGNGYKKGFLLSKDGGEAAVVKNSAAAKAGFKEGDLIVSIDGIEVNGDKNLTDIIQSYAAGDTVKISFLRGGTELEVSVVLDEVK